MLKVFAPNKLKRKDKVDEPDGIKMISVYVSINKPIFARYQIVLSEESCHDC